MTHAIDRLGLAVALTLSLGLAGTALAADAPARTAQAAAPPAAAPGSPGVTEVQRQLADLQRRLNITPAQRPQFDAFAQAMRQNAQEMDALVQRTQPKGHPTAVEQLQISVQMATAEADGLKRLLPPLQALYDTLSDAQKRTADQVFAGPPASAPPAKR